MEYRMNPNGWLFTEKEYFIYYSQYIPNLSVVLEMWKECPIIEANKENREEIQKRLTYIYAPKIDSSLIDIMKPLQIMYNVHISQLSSAISNSVISSLHNMGGDDIPGDKEAD